MTREEAIRWMTVLKQSKINWIGDTNKIAGIKAECEKAEQEAFDMAIEALSTEVVHIETYRKLYEKYMKLKHVSDEAVQEWIPCSERLPETGDSILVTYSDEEVGIVWSARPKAWGKYEKANNLIFPIAWQPLPTPYKGGDDE